jgi:hypothetical protein
VFGVAGHASDAVLGHISQIKKEQTLCPQKTGDFLNESACASAVASDIT